MVDAKWLTLGAPVSLNRAPVLQAINVNDANDRVATVFSPLTTDPITELMVFSHVVTGTPPTNRISLQSVDGAGKPSGTVLGGGSPASANFNVTVIGAQWVTLDNAYTPTAGDEVLSRAVEYVSGTVNTSNRASWVYGLLTLQRSGLPYSLIDNGSGTDWVPIESALSLFGYGTATKRYGMPVANATLINTFNSTSSPDEFAMKFTIPSEIDTLTVAAIRLVLSKTTGGSYKFTLYEGGGASDDTVLQTVTLDSDFFYAANQGVSEIAFAVDGALSTLSGGSTYRIGVSPQSAVNISTYRVGFEDTTDLAVIPFGTDFSMSNRVDGGNWTDEPTQRMVAEIKIEDITYAGSGGGLLVHPGMTGGISG